MREHFEDRVVISGIGLSDVGRRLQRDPWALTAQAALRAIADGGLGPDDIDGVSTYPGGAYPPPGLSGAGLWDVRRMLGLDLRWLSGGSEVAGQIGSVINAAVAVGSGIVDHVLVFPIRMGVDPPDGHGACGGGDGPALVGRRRRGACAG